MPACTDYDILEVTGSNTSLDGLYYKYIDLWSNSNYSAWTKPQGAEPITLLSSTILHNNTYGWCIINDDLPFYTLLSNVTCPVDLTLDKFFFNDIPGAANTALIKAYTPPNNIQIRG